MAYIRQQKIGRFVYIYVVASVRRKGTPYPVPKVLEYLGRADKIDPKRLAKALRYWGVKAKPDKGRR